MSLCEDMLLCNYRKCRIKLSGYPWVTACSHIFCDQHGSGEFSRSPAICPACSSTLSGKLDIVRTELSLSEEYKATVLAGLRPEIVYFLKLIFLAFMVGPTCSASANLDNHLSKIFKKKNKK
uniref:RING-type domain-containing protein n=1 Tax=Cebus imitator TaxID=2715852 RepID=A0A2K5R963_CEBIM